MHLQLLSPKIEGSNLCNNVSYCFTLNLGLSINLLPVQFEKKKKKSLKNMKILSFLQWNSRHQVIRTSDFSSFSLIGWSRKVLLLYHLFSRRWWDVVPTTRSSLPFRLLNIAVGTSLLFFIPCGIGGPNIEVLDYFYSKKQFKKMKPLIFTVCLV